MPNCKICKTRIPVDVTGVSGYRCRICGKTFCRAHFIVPRGTCILCAGISEEQALRKKNPKTTSAIMTSTT